jgi:dextranase
VTELLPTKATFAPGESVEVELRAAGRPVDVSLTHLDRVVQTVTVRPGDDVARFPPQPEGGYGVEGAGATTAVDVLADPLTRPRYGFVSHYEPGRDPAGVAELARRLHLNAVQFYDWMYRHAQLLPPQDEYEDALGQQLSLSTVRRLAAAVRSVGSLPLGYAAVYAVGNEERPQWDELALLRGDGEPWGLGDDFLWIIDPTDERWLGPFALQLADAVGEVGFAGFHLDQYGAPKRALRRDGRVVDLAEAFPRIVDRLADALPGSRLIFNNVNDFPTWATARARQDATYIEVWPPHERLTHLAGLVTKARLLAPDRAVILAAYLEPYARDEETAKAAECLLLATVFSHGGSALLHGEERAVLTNAYYVRHAEVSDDTVDTVRRYVDFAVRYGDLLYDPAAVDVTRTHLGGENGEVVVEAPVPVATDCLAGALWARAVRCSRGLLVSLIDLSAQTEVAWNAPKQPGEAVAGIRVALERTADATILFASPESSPALRTLTPTREGRYDIVIVPPFSTWGLLWVRDALSP